MCLTITEGVRVRAWFVVMLVFVLCRKKNTNLFKGLKSEQGND